MKPQSLLGRLQVTISVFVLATAFIGVLFFSAVQMTTVRTERRQVVESIGTALTHLVARGVSLGDYLGVEDSLRGTRLPRFIASATVEDLNGSVISTLSKELLPATDLSKIAVEQYTFPISQTVDVGLAGDAIGRVTFLVDNSDLHKRLLFTILTALGLGLVLIITVAFASRIVLRRSLSPLKKAVDLAILRKKPDDDLTSKAPLEIQPLLQKIDNLYEDFALHEADIRVGSIASRVAHDIRSPLSVLNLVLRNSHEIPNDRMTLVNAAIDRINSIAKEILTTYRSNPSQLLSQKSIAHLVEQVAHEKQVEAGASGKTVSLAETNFPLVRKFWLHAVDFERTVSNVINNSIDAVERGGEVSVTVVEDAESLIVKVRDTGKGIPPEILKNLGTRKITHGKENGSGLGLYQANRFLNRMGGQLLIESKLNVGTQVTMIFPEHKETR